jgi:hypothetical protein
MTHVGLERYFLLPKNLVNKHNLQVYTKTFQFIHNIRIKTSVRKKMLERILIGS